MLQKSSFQYLALLGFTVLFCTTQLQAQRDVTPTKKDTLIVGIAGNEPFVFIRNSAFKGISIEIWEDLAIKKDWAYRYKSFETVDVCYSAA